MARSWILAAILVLCGCREKAIPATTPPPSPQVPPMDLRIMPGDYKPVSGKGQNWQLTTLRLFTEGDYDSTMGKPRRRERPPLPPSLSMACNGTLRSFFLWNETDLSITAVNAALVIARIPRSLHDGQTWDFTAGQRRQTGSCRADGDLFRVDINEDGKTRYSMWFSRVDGLVRWEGIAPSPLVRVPPPAQVAAEAYADWGRVDDEARWAPALCREPRKPTLRTSASRDEATHGRKQYYLFAKDREAYRHALDMDQPDGQVVVKESWIPGEPRTKGPLFLMLKSGEEWIYATATPDGKTITASGKLASCIECHESDRTRDRMFGLASGASPR